MFSTYIHTFYLGVGKYTPNAAVNGDIGWTPPYVRQMIAVSSHWYNTVRPAYIRGYSIGPISRVVIGVKTGILESATNLIGSMLTVLCRMQNGLFVMKFSLMLWTSMWKTGKRK
jgi:hypothetical protein